MTTWNETMRVQVIDPQANAVYPGELVRDAGGFRLNRLPAADLLGQQPDLYLSPGWIDLHTHVYDGVTPLSVKADDVGLRTGVHLVVDAGSAGEATVRGFREYVAPRSETQILAWLHISSIGLVHLQESTDLSLLSVERTVKAIAEHRPFLCGVKARISSDIVGANGTQPLVLAKQAARETGLPLMVHIGEAPPAIDEVLDLLDAGDVITHCYHGKTGHPWGLDGLPRPALTRALARGVKLDVGHGAASFSFDVCRRALAAGHAPFSISTDVHMRNIHGPVYDLATTMSKLLTLGMELPDVVTAVTLAPSEVLRLPGWCGLDGTLPRATLFRLAGSARGGEMFRDAEGAELPPERVIEPTAIIRGQDLIRLDSNYSRKV